MRAHDTRRRRNRTGYTLVELMIVVAMIAALAGFGTPLLSQFVDNLRLKGAARETADAFRLARIEAIRTQVPHIVFLSASAAGDPPATDPAGNPLPNDPATGNLAPVPLLIVRDDNENCLIDAADPAREIHAKRNVAWGSAVSGGVSVGTDTGLPDHSTGSSFATPARGPATWVVFGADGIPVAFDGGCNPNFGNVGSGGGAVYLTNGRRDYAIVMSPLGNVRVHNWLEGTASWSN
jgi:prepilin-type N-terminal cleavage/methylation domain-containing protein